MYSSKTTISDPNFTGTLQILEHLNGPDELLCQAKFKFPTMVRGINADSHKPIHYLWSSALAFYV